MANYATAALVTAQAKLATKYNEAELRRKRRPVINMALQNADYAIPDAARLKVAESRPVEVHYKLAKAPGASVVKAARHTGGVGDSAKVTLVWSRLTETFSFSRKRMQDKVIGAQEAFNHEIDQAIQNLQDRAEAAIVAYAVAQRCQLLAAGITTSGQGTWSDVNKALEISLANQSYFVQNIKAFMYGRHYRGELDLIADVVLASKLERVQAQGAGNQTNTSFQFGGVNIATTTDAILAAYNTNGSGLLMPKGLLSAMPWNDPLNRSNFGRPDDYVGMFTTMQDPYGLGLAYDVSVYTDRADTSGASGHIQDVVDQYEISLLIAHALPPLSLANDSVIHLVAQAAA